MTASGEFGVLALVGGPFGGPNLLTVIGLGLPGAILLGSGFVIAGSYGNDYTRFGLGVAMLLFGSLLFLGSVIMLFGWAVKTLRS